MFAVSSVLASNAMAQTLDPWRVSNERIFNFNDFIDEIVVKPVARTYSLFVPRFGRQFIGNFFSNIDDINVFVNDLLQLKFDAAVSDCGRFLINSSIGLFGFFDVATGFELRKNEEDFGQTLAHWGVEDGPYLVLPLIGPSNLRDATGRFVDRYPHPLNWSEEESGEAWAWGLRALNGTQIRADLDDTLGSLNRTAIDPYVQARSAWRQSRTAFIESQGATDEDYQNLPEFE